MYSRNIIRTIGIGIGIAPGALAVLSLAAFGGTPPIVGDVLPDGTISGGIAVETGKEWAIAPADEVGAYSWRKAEAQCRSKGEGWFLPTEAQLDYMNKYRDRIGPFKGPNLTDLSDWYWSLAENAKNEDHAWAQRFPDGHQQLVHKRMRLSVRCVKS